MNFKEVETAVETFNSRDFIQLRHTVSKLETRRSRLLSGALIQYSNFSVAISSCLN